MRITKQTEDELRLDHTPWFPAVIPLGFLIVTVFTCVMQALRGEWQAAGQMLIGIAICFGMLTLVAVRTQFWANRSSGQAVYRKQSFFGRKEQLIPLTDIREVVVDTWQSRKSGRQQRLEVVLTNGSRINLGIATSLTQTTDGLAQVIRGWLRLTERPR